MADRPAPPVDRLLAGELSPADQRRVAQAALDDPDLFDTLMAAAAVETALAPSHPARRTAAADRPDPPSAFDRRPARWRFAAFGAITAAATLVLAIAYERSTRTSAPPAQITATAEPPVAIAPPLLLIARADAAPDQTFRADAARSRPPKQIGTITGVQDGLIDVDLGSIDGVKQGSTLRTLRGRAGGSDAGRLTITTVFRERSRGRAVAGDATREGDRLEVAPSAHVTALLEQAAARRTAGDIAGARALAGLAASRAHSPDVPADVRRQALAQLGILEHQAGDANGAASSLRAATVEFDTAPVASPSERATVLNELGAIQIEQRDYAAAERTLRAADGYAAGAAKVHVANNLGAVAALRGDRTTAESLYRLAQSLAGDTPERAADRERIATNLRNLAATR